MTLLNLPSRLITQGQLIQITNALSSGVNYVTKYQGVQSRATAKIQKSMAKRGAPVAGTDELMAESNQSIADALDEMNRAQNLLGNIALGGAPPSTPSAEQTPNMRGWRAPDLCYVSTRATLQHLIESDQLDEDELKAAALISLEAVAGYEETIARLLDDDEIPPTPDVLDTLRGLVAYCNKWAAFESDPRFDRAIALLAGLEGGAS